MKRSRLNWHNDAVTRRFLWEEHLLRTRAALNQLFEMGIVAVCPGGRYKLTPAAQWEYKWSLL